MDATHVFLSVFLLQCGVNGTGQDGDTFDFDAVNDLLDSHIKPVGWGNLMDMGLSGTYKSRDGSKEGNRPPTDEELMFMMDVNQTKCSLKSNTEKCNCGIRMGRRIVGGERAKKNEHPWMATIYKKGKKQPHCGGTLISNRWVLTAAHCVYGVTSVSDIWIVLGDYRIRDKDEGEVKMGVDDIVTTNFRYSTGHQDIALYSLNASVELGRSIYPACLPRAFDDCVWTGHNVTIAGWGQIAEKNYTQPNYLQVTQLPVVSWKYCATKYYHLERDNLCTYDNNKDNCNGDSGGPVLFEQNGRHYVIGVVSWGKGCARKKPARGRCECRGIPGLDSRSNRRLYLHAVDGSQNYSKRHLSSGILKIKNS